MATKTLKNTLSTLKNAPKLNVQRSYITLKLPTGNFTNSYGGAKCSLDKYVQITCKTKTVGEAMNDLLNPALLNKLVPGWDKPLIADTFVAGDTVSFVPGLFSKKYPGNFEVVSVKGKYVYIKVINNRSKLYENVGFEAITFKK
jgi:hypothetical protein